MLHASEITYKLPDDVPERFIKDGTFLFAAYGCALTERQMPSGMYVYTAISLSNGKHKILSRRKRRLDVSDFAGMAAKISALPFRGNARLNVEKSPGERMELQRLKETAHHIFTEIMPEYGYAVRDKQIELAEHILTVTGRRGITLAESEVGTGKTLAYLIAAALVKRGRLGDIHLRGHYPRQSWADSAYMPVVISTSSIALQKAIDTDYIPELSNILLQHEVIDTPLTSAVRKGKEHYICERRLERFMQNADERTQALLTFFSGEHAPLDLTGADRLSAYMKRGICVSGVCPAQCSYAAKCRYSKHIKRINDPKIDFQITNHNYFLADMLHRASGKRPLLPHYQLVIIDEAHKFLAAARSMYGLELAATALPELAREVHSFIVGKSKHGVNVHRLAKKLEEQSDRLFRRLNDNIPESEKDDDAERFHTVMDEEVCRYLKKLGGISADLAVAITDSTVPKLYRDRQSKVIWRLNMICEHVSELRQCNRLIHWLEKRTEGEKVTDALCAIPTDLDERLHHDLWRNGIPVVLTSGTLSASGHFTRIKQTLGIDRLPSYRVFDTSMTSPFDHKRNALLYISEHTPFPDNSNKEYISAIADEIERLVTAAHGHAAVLFTSYNVMGQVYAILRARDLPFPLFRLERGSVQAIERFKQSGNGILLASGALWEGIDIPGDTLSLLVIVKLPFAVPDPIGDYERSLCDSMEVYKTQAVVPDMLVKLKQGFGRLIRSETDTGVVAMLDSRMRIGGAYRDRVLAALPECGVTSSVEEVRRFMLEKKEAPYFKGGRS